MPNFLFYQKVLLYPDNLTLLTPVKKRLPYMALVNCVAVYVFQTPALTVKNRKAGNIGGERVRRELEPFILELHCLRKGNG